MTAQQFNQSVTDSIRNLVALTNKAKLPSIRQSDEDERRRDQQGDSSLFSAEADRLFQHPPIHCCDMCDWADQQGKI